MLLCFIVYQDILDITIKNETESNNTLTRAGVPSSAGDKNEFNRFLYNDFKGNSFDSCTDAVYDALQDAVQNGILTEKEIILSKTDN